MSQSSTPAVTDAIYDASSLGRPRMFVLGLQHMFAMFGATVLSVRGTYDDAFELSLRATAEFGWYNRNTGFNPYLLEGK